MNEGRGLQKGAAGMRTMETVGAAPPRADVGGRLTLRLCGGLTVAGERASLGPRELGGAKSRQILIALSARPGQPVSKSHLVHLMWGDEPPLGAIGTLETYVSLLRKRLEGLAARGGAVIRTVPGGYALDAERVLIDMEAFDRGCRSAREPGLAPGIALDRWSAALDTIEGEYLAGEAGPSWVDEARHQHDLRLAGALAEAAESALRAGVCDLAEQHSARGLALDVLHERCWRSLLESYEARGLHAEGLRAYDLCRRSFAEALGCAPGPHVQAVYERLLSGTGESAQDGLNAAVEAVVQLYISLSPDRRGCEAQPGTQASVVAQAYRVLDDLLLRARGTGAPMALSA